MEKIFKCYKTIFFLTLIFGIHYLMYSQSTLNKTNNISNVVTANNSDSVIELFPLRNIYFDFGSTNIRQVDIKNLEQIVIFLNKYPTIKLEINGHTDNQETQSLSTSRSQVVYSWFINHGIEKQRIIYKGMGNVYPISSNNNPESRQLNRRIEFSVAE